MNKRGLGVIFFLISAILLSTTYITAAIVDYSLSIFQNEFWPLLLLSASSLIVGICYFIEAKNDDKNSKDEI